MLILLAAVAGGMAVGYLRGGRLGALGRVPLRAPALVGAAVVAQLLLGGAPRAVRFPAVVATYGLVGWWLVLNLIGRPRAWRVALVLLALGWAANVAAIVPNRGMPVSAAALDRLGVPAGVDVGAGNLHKHVRAGPRSPLPWLGDVIPLPPLRSVISVGDIALAGGIALAVAAAMGPSYLDRKEVITP